VRFARGAAGFVAVLGADRVGAADVPVMRLDAILGSFATESLASKLLVGIVYLHGGDIGGLRTIFGAGGSGPMCECFVYTTIR
jgi:hypothetical protein